MKALGSLIWVEGKLFGRETLTIVFAFAVPLVALYMLASSFGNVPDPSGRTFEGVGPLDFYVPVYVVLTAAAVGLIVLPVHLADHREHGVLRRFQASTAHEWSVVASLVLAATGTATGAVLLLIGVAFVFGHAALPGHPLASSLAYVFVALTFAAVGMMLGTILRHTRTVRSVGIVLWSASLVLSGASLPVEVLPGAVRSLGHALPVYWPMRLVQESWRGHPWSWAAFGWTALLLVLCAVIAWRYFRWD